MKNDQARPTGTGTLPEANVISYCDPHCNRENRGRENSARLNRPRHKRRGSQRMAHKTEANVVKAHAFMVHVVGTTIHRSQKPEMRGTLARPVAPRFRMISITDEEELIIGPAPVVHQRKL